MKKKKKGATQDPWREFVKDFRQELELHLEWFYRRYSKHMAVVKRNNPRAWLDKELNGSFQHYIKDLARNDVLVSRLTHDFNDFPEYFTFSVGPAKYNVCGHPRTLAILHRKAGQRMITPNNHKYQRSAW